MSRSRLVDSSMLGVPAVDGLPELRRGELPASLPPVHECGETLVGVPPEVSPMPMYWLESWPGAQADLLVRAGVAQRLVEAADRLPGGFGLVLLDGWRSDVLQSALFRHYYEGNDDLPPGYVSKPDDESRIAPHATGGAIDVTLSWQGQALALGTPFDSFDERAWPDALEQTGEEPNRSLRRLLSHVLYGAGFVAYPLEWWHFSFGDQLWASELGRDFALYGKVAPSEPS